MRMWLFLGLLAMPAAVLHALDNLPPLFPGVKPRGPHVEVSLRDGQEPFYCFLTGYKNGQVSFQMLGGEVRQERSADVRSIRYLPSQAEGGPPPAGPERKPALSADSQRLRELGDKDQQGALTPSEIEELYKLREKTPVFQGEPGPMERRKLAKNLAQREENKGRIDRHIGLYQKRLKKVETEEEARDLLVMLEVAYFQKRPQSGPAKVKEQLKADIQNIANEGIRRRVENFADSFDFPRPFRKDK